MTLHENRQLFADAIQAASETLGIKRHFVEKDYWICRSLQQMVRADDTHRAVFKGGTSLTKAYGIGSRFSEDIDIAIANADQMTGNQLKTTIHRTARCMTEGLTEVPKPGVTSKGSHYYKAFFAYPALSDVPTTSSVNMGELLVEINCFANPYPWQMKRVQSFVTEFLRQTGNDAIVGQYDLGAIEVPVLDKCCTLSEKLVSLIRCSLANKYVEQMNAKIRHFYDLYYLYQDTDCRRYMESDAFLRDFRMLLRHDREQFSKPDGWQNRPLSDSPLVRDWHSTWHVLLPTYLRELPDLSYRNIPPADEIEQSMRRILTAVESIHE